MIWVLVVVACSIFFAEAGLNVPQTIQCCNVIESSSELMQCIDSLEPNPPESPEIQLSLVTYASPDIVDYAAYAFAINSAYAEHNSYEIFFMSPESGSNYEPLDQRWNRVKILQDALEPVSGWLRDVDYVVWIDADLVFLDLNLNLLDIVKENSEYDIIISAERHAETGVANTGCFIAKNTEWTRKFLNDWWTKYDHSINHDQIFFDKLYKSMMPGVASHVKILPADEINSTPPPTLYQKPENKVLHLMGQAKPLRKKVFKLGFEEICRAVEENTDIEPQLGLTQPRLYSMALQYFENDLARLIEVLENEEEVKSLPPDRFIETTSSARELVVQLNIYQPNQRRADVTSVLFNAVRARTILAESRKEKEARYLPSFYNAYAVYGNDMIAYISDPEERLQLYAEIEATLNKLEIVVSKHQLFIVKELKLRLYSSVAQVHLEAKDYTKSEAYFLKSMKLHKDMGNAANPVYTIEPLNGLASVKCMQGQIEEGVDFFIESIALQEKFLSAEQQLKEDHITLATTFLRSAGCMAKGGGLKEAKAVLSRSYDILSRHPEKHRTESLLLSWKRIDDQVTSLLKAEGEEQFLKELEDMRVQGIFRTVPYTQGYLDDKSSAPLKSSPTSPSSSSSTPSSNAGGAKTVKKLMKKKKKKSSSDDDGEF
jgi:tetratricopeptide (TPR) repeat protein